MATRRSNPYARTWKGFVDQTAQHQLTVLHDEVLYRHLRMAAPGTSMWHWEVVTWPGHLSITGDVADGFTFRSRSSDRTGDCALRIRSSGCADGCSFASFRAGT